jgi:hypothetical protein
MYVHVNFSCAVRQELHHRLDEAAKRDQDLASSAKGVASLCQILADASDVELRNKVNELCQSSNQKLLKVRRANHDVVCEGECAGCNAYPGIEHKIKLCLYDLHMDCVDGFPSTQDVYHQFGTQLYLHSHGHPHYVAKTTSKGIPQTTIRKYRASPSLACIRMPTPGRENAPYPPTNKILNRIQKNRFLTMNKCLVCPGCCGHFRRHTAHVDRWWPHTSR